MKLKLEIKYEHLGANLIQYLNVKVLITSTF